ncbi:hypothetical protein IMZ48_26315 [Candidatus Bathyarchaeota archaeon]|nr:hypothetical protein [Candidatus Bathyarchaeota archaeon]
MRLERGGKDRRHGAKTNKTRAIFTGVTAYEAIEIRNNHPSPTETEAAGAHPPVASV